MKRQLADELPDRRTVPLAVPNIGDLEEAAVVKALRSGWVSSVGPDVSDFENRIASLSGTSSAVAVASGTSAIMLALKALGVGVGETVLCPTYTFIATANAICAAGAKPVFVDISPDTWAMDVSAAQQAIERVIQETGSAPKAAIVVYPLGNPVDHEPFRQLFDKYSMKWVIDAAAAIGAKWKGGPIGSLADATTFSFNGNKTVTCGGGGAVVGQQEIVEKVRHLATTGRVGNNYDHDIPAYNERMTNLEAALGCAQLERLGSFLERKRECRKRYQRLSEILGCSISPRSVHASDGDWFSAIVLREDDPDIRDIVAALNREGVLVRLFWKPMHLQQAFSDIDGNTGAFPVSTNLWQRVLPLPSSTSLTTDELDFVCETVVSVFETLRSKK